MAAEQTERVPRETWRDWLTPDAAQALLGPRADKSLLITRAELLERLGGSVTERELRYWESSGALPRPVRQFHRGAVQALYPSWHVDVVSNVRESRAEKLSPDEMRADARAIFEGFAAHLAGWHPRSGPHGGPPVPHGLIEEIEQFTRQLATKHGLRIAAATLHLQTEQGRQLSWSFPLFGGGATTLGYRWFDDTAEHEQIVSESPSGNKNKQESHTG